MALQRIDKILVGTGLWSRKEVKELVRQNRVTVDGRAIKKPEEKADTDTMRIQVNGKDVDCSEFVYIMMNKPEGLLSATEDKKQKTVLDLLPEPLRRKGLGPVGRLDKDVTGLVLLTTDGQLAHRLISPRWKAEKLYRARCEGRLTEAEAEAFAGGIELSDFTAKPARLEILEASEEGSTADVVLTEGKFHQVKRMFAAVGHPLVALERLRIGCVTLDPALGPGEWRELTGEEARGLLALCGMDEINLK